MNINFLILLVATTLALSDFSLIAEEKEPERNDHFQPLDLFDLSWVTDPQISPSGNKIVYVKSGFDIMKDKGRNSLWVINADGSDHEPLTGFSSSESSPRWSPGGRRLAYVSDSEGSVQIHVRWMNTDRDLAITQLTHRPDSLVWSPDGKRLAFRMFVPEKRDPIAKPLEKPEHAKWAPEAKVIEDLLYRSDARGFLKTGSHQLFMISSNGGMPVQLTSKKYPHDRNLSWSPNGNKILFTSNYDEDWQKDIRESEIFSVEINTKKVVQITDRKGPDHSPAVSPKGDQFIYLGSDNVRKHQNTELYLSRLSKHKPRVLTAQLDTSVTGAKWASNGKSIYISYVEKAITKVARLNLSGKITELTKGLGGTSIGRPYSSGAFSVSNKGAIAHDLTSTSQPANLALTSSGRTRKLTDLNTDLVEHREMAQVEEIWFKSADSLPIQGWIVKPPGFDKSENRIKKYPLILEIHGGPYTSYAKEFSAEIQLYAAAGYVVLYTNPRGSTSYGLDFTLKIHHKYPGQDYDDLMAGVDAVISKGYIDESRLYVTGGSGGGVLTAWIVGKTDRFRAAVSAKPVINWYTHTLTADIGPFFWEINFDKLPWEDPAAYMALSPISLISKVKTPTMLLTGERDYRTPMSESEQYYQALKMKGVDSALVRIQDASHSIAARPSNLLRKVAYILGWFDRYKE